MSYLEARGIVPHTRRKTGLSAIIICLLYYVYAIFVLEKSYNESRYYDQYQQQHHNVSPLSSFDKDMKGSSDSYLIQSLKGKNDDMPSHIQMCTYLAPRLEYALSKHNVDMKIKSLGLTMEGLNMSSIPNLNVKTPNSVEMENILVEEDETICVSKDSPSKSLIRIFSSTLLHISATKFGLNVEYRQNCHFYKELNQIKYNNMPIQQMLPPGNLFIDDLITSEMSFDILSIRNMCKDCINIFNQSPVNSENCVLFGKPTTLKVKQYPANDNTQLTENLVDTLMQHRRPIGIETMLPLMRSTFFSIADNWQKDSQGLMKMRLQLHPSKPKGLLSQLNNQTKTESSAKTIVVYITCIDEDCETVKDSIALPFNYYDDAISYINNLSSISIIVSHSCASKVDGCLSYGQALFTLFIQKYSELQIELIESKSSYNLYSKIILSDDLICSPSNACLLLGMLSLGRSTLATTTKKDMMVSFLPSYLADEYNIHFQYGYRRTSVTELNHNFLIGA